MTLTSRALSRTVSKAPRWQPVPSWQSGVPQPMQLNYLSFAKEGYGGNAIVYAALNEIMSSASEPSMMVRLGAEWTHDHPLLTLMNRPNPFMDRYSFTAAILMFYFISGNAYALKVRSGSGRVVELWILRPDRIRIVPDENNFIRRYDFSIGGDSGMGAVSVPLSVRDVIHWKKPHPFNDFYGLSPLQVIAPHIDTDNYIREFIKAYFTNAGIPGGMLTVKQSLSDAAKKEIRERFRSTFTGPSGWHELLLLDNAEAQFTPMTAQLGQRGLVVPELDEILEARLAMPFGVPLSLIGARLGMSSSSYGNRKSDREGFWDETLSPLYKEIAGPLNLSLVPEFTADEIAYDLTDVRALQPDFDAVSARIVKEVNGGVRSVQSAWQILNIKPPEPTETLLIPANLVPTPASVLEEAGKQGVQIPPPRVTERTQGDTAPSGDNGNAVLETPPPSSNGRTPASNGAKP